MTSTIHSHPLNAFCIHCKGTYNICIKILAMAEFEIAAHFQTPGTHVVVFYLGCVMTTPIFLLISPRLTRHMKARSEERSSIM